MAAKADYATIEAIGLKIWSLEKEAIYAKDDHENAKLYAQIEALWWAASLLGISDDVSKVRQKQTVLSNKQWEAAKKCALREAREHDHARNERPRRSL